MYAVYGAGGFGREVMPLIKGAVFIDDNLIGLVNGYRVVSEADFLTQHEKYFNIAIADCKTRKRIAERLCEAGAMPFDIVSRDTVQYEENKCGEGVIICAHCIITSNATIGKFFHMNLDSYVAHDCLIGDFVTFAPKVCCNGNVTIGDNAYIGTGAIIRQGITIGEGAVVGQGAVVVKDVEPYTTVVGNPAKELIKKGG